MNKRFSVINKRGLVFSAAVMGIFGILSGVSLAKMLSGSSNFWLLGVIVFVTLMIISALVITLVVTAGVEVKSNMYFDIGCTDKGDKVYPLHNEHLCPDEECMRTGMLVEVLSTLRILNKEFGND